MSSNEPTGNVHELRPKRDLAPSWEPIDLASLPDLPPKTPEIAGLLYRGASHVLSGPPGVGKSWVALCLALSEIRDGRTAWLVDFEMSAAETRSRLIELGATKEQLSRMVYILRPSEPLPPAKLLELEERYGTPAFVTFDSSARLYGLYDLDPNLAADVERLERQLLDLLDERGISVLVIDHVTHASETRDRPIGSQRKLAAADVHLSVRGSSKLRRGRSSTVQLFGAKDRHGHLQDLTVELVFVSNEDGAIEWQFREPITTAGEGASEERLAEVKEAISRLLEFVPDGGTRSRNQIEVEMPYRAVTVREALDELVADGYLAETHGAKRARLYSSTKPYRAQQ